MIRDFAGLYLHAEGFSGHNAGGDKTLENAEDIASFSSKCPFGGVAERPIAPVLKTGDVARRPRVRISPPPLILQGFTAKRRGVQKGVKMAGVG